MMTPALAFWILLGMAKQLALIYGPVILMIIGLLLITVFARG